ncbi:penicillin-binding protein [Brevibacillus fluminis]|uniref:Penicillin-binding protein n=1 Tax=Brevibacillus fluminis TaxID=511487 RepID=A0A3M8D9E6_9BACL|nr:biosynthetic peptidoglycan transglycosylase [Brevibacillus fluminis]RNB84578.1 penicillin-binding protein [Brevibacillus fluminis]
MNETGMILERPLLHEKTIDDKTSQVTYMPAAEQATDRRTMARLRWRILLTVLMCLPFFAYIGMVGTGYLLADQQQLVQLEASIQNGWIKGEKGLPDRPAVRIQDLPPYVYQSIIAIEDHRFYQHAGVDPRGLARAVYVDLLEGQKAQGGSTITMQLARNLFLTQDKTFLRKGKEMALALYLDQAYTKQQLLEVYMNQVYYGHGKYGIESAANLYFGKTVKKGVPGKSTITENEAAMLAGLLKSPETYSPLKNEAKAKARGQIVLQRMDSLGYRDLSATGQASEHLLQPAQ